jgi:hypothetical protein
MFECHFEFHFFSRGAYRDYNNRNEVVSGGSEENISNNKLCCGKNNPKMHSVLMLFQAPIIKYGK